MSTLTMQPNATKAKNSMIERTLDKTEQGEDLPTAKLRPKSLSDYIGQKVIDPLAVFIHAAKASRKP